MAKGKIKKQSSNTYFLNPYNFVRYLDERPDYPNDPNDVKILGECEPPPHDRWIGLSGRIDCRATLVTPLFIADAEMISPDPKADKHKHYKFFNVNGVKKVPASSLRGMLRNIYEAATNSRFGTFQIDEFPLEYRQAKVPEELTPVRVIGFDRNGGATLEILDVRKPTDDKKKIMSSAWVPAYTPQVRYKKKREKETIPGNDILMPRITALHSTYKRKRLAALVKVNPTKHRKRPFYYYEIKKDSIVLAKDHHELPDIDGWEKVFGYLYITGPNIGHKHHERFFFRRNDKSERDYTYKDLKGSDFVTTVPPHVVNEYNQRLSEYYERNKNDAKLPRTPSNWPLTSSFVKKDNRLKKGDVLYLIDDKNKKQRYFLRPVTIPRLPYDWERQEFLSKQYHPAKNKRQLSPADRLFGWVAGQDGEGAYAGRLHVSHGDFDQDKFDVLKSEIQLAILSTPKPTTTRFYLSHKNWKSQERPHYQAGYDNRCNNRLRGRKIYRHFMPSQLNKKYYQSHEKDKSEQNRTVHDVVDKNSEFTFSINFENLNPVELGALLWSIEMEDGMFHRLGLAKPFGFGSLKIRIEEQENKGVYFLDVEDRYRLLDKDGWSKPVSKKNRDILITRFKKAMVKRYLPKLASNPEKKQKDNDEWLIAFMKLDNIADLKALLSETTSDIPIHYPHLPRKIGKHFEWFMRNKKPKRKNIQRKNIRGEWVELEVPAKEAKGNGLPLNVTGEKRV